MSDNRKFSTTLKKPTRVQLEHDGKCDEWPAAHGWSSPSSGGGASTVAAFHHRT